MISLALVLLWSRLVSKQTRKGYFLGRSRETFTFKREECRQFWSSESHSEALVTEVVTVFRLRKGNESLDALRLASPFPATSIETRPAAPSAFRVPLSWHHGSKQTETGTSCVINFQQERTKLSRANLTDFIRVICFIRAHIALILDMRISQIMCLLEADYKMGKNAKCRDHNFIYLMVHPLHLGQ